MSTQSMLVRQHLMYRSVRPEPDAAMTTLETYHQEPKIWSYANTKPPGFIQRLDVDENDGDSAEAISLEGP